MSSFQRILMVILCKVSSQLKSKRNLFWKRIKLIVNNLFKFCWRVNSHLTTFRVLNHKNGSLEREEQEAVEMSGE